MILTTVELGLFLQKELDKGYDIKRIARSAFELYHYSSYESSDPGIDDKLFLLITMEEGPEFEYSEKDLREFAADWISSDHITPEPNSAMTLYSRLKGTSRGG